MLSLSGDFYKPCLKPSLKFYPHKETNWKTLQQIPIENSNDYLVVPDTNLPAGGYLCSIIQNDKPIQCARSDLLS